MSDHSDLVRHYGGDGFVGRLDDALTKAVGCRSRPSAFRQRALWLRDNLPAYIFLCVLE